MSVTLALLIGGHGTRLGGVDKAGLLVGGKPLGETLIEVTRPFVREIMVVGRSAQEDHALARQYRFVVDSVEEQGPLQGIASALAYTTTPWIFALAGDTYALAASDIEPLLAARTRATCAVGWLSDHGPEPLCALYSRAITPKARRLLAGGERRARALLENERLLKRSNSIANINTADELRDARVR